jgi:type IV pilus assembly protein PilE
VDKKKSDDKTCRGFTLIEMMIVLTIVAILAAIAYPAYTNAITKARRSDAIDALLNIQSLQEKYRANNPTYGTLVQIGAAANSADNYYTLALANIAATSYTATADGTGSSQSRDTSNPVNCTVLNLTVNAANPRGVRGSTDAGGGAECWAN